jgi:hypothetical protein
LENVSQRSGRGGLRQQGMAAQKQHRKDHFDADIHAVSLPAPERLATLLPQRAFGSGKYNRFDLIF